MFRIPDKEVGIVIHDVLNVIRLLKTIEMEMIKCSSRKRQHCKNRSDLLHECEIKLVNLRQEILSSLEDEKGE